MNKNMKIGLLIMATGLVLAGCASLNQKIDGLMTPKWDKNEKSTAVLYYDEFLKIHKIDGKPKLNAFGQEMSIGGSKGTEKKPEARTVIPAGERKLEVSYVYFPSDSSYNRPPAGLRNWDNVRYEVPYTFVAGRYYQLVARPNRDVPNPAVAALNKQLDEQKAKREELGKQIEAASNNMAEMTRLRDQLKPIDAEILRLAQELNKVPGAFAMNLQIIDITGGKKKNSPSSVVTVKSW